MRKGEDRTVRGTCTLAEILMGGGVALLLNFAFLAIMALLISCGILGDSGAVQLIALSCFISCFVGGRAAIRKRAGRQLLMGLGSGAIFVILILLIGFLCLDSMQIGAEGILFYICALAGGGLSGMLRGKAKKKKRK